MKLRPAIALAALSLSTWFGAQAQAVLAMPCLDADKVCAGKALREHRVRRLDHWQQARDLPKAERIAPAPADLVEYLTLDNISNGYPERPRAATLDGSFLADVQGAIADLPPDVWRLFGRRLLGVYFVENLGGTGYTDVVQDAAGKPVAGYIVLDAGVLARQSANAWATWKENTPFKPQAGYRLNASIEGEAGDNRRNAIQYILLHELGHVLSIGGTIHPPWSITPAKLGPTARYAFFNLSWKVDRRADRYSSRFDAGFPQRKRVVYYFGARLAATQMRATYASLARTNFPSLYAATRPGDDFAESFASYVHVVRMQRPWQVTILRDGKSALVFKACWDQPRCAKKRRLLERVLADAAAGSM